MSKASNSSQIDIKGAQTQLNQFDHRKRRLDLPSQAEELGHRRPIISSIDTNDAGLGDSSSANRGKEGKVYGISKEQEDALRRDLVNDLEGSLRQPTSEEGRILAELGKYPWLTKV